VEQNGEAQLFESENVKSEYGFCYHFLQINFHDSGVSASFLSKNKIICRMTAFAEWKLGIWSF
jgi:hypothetical protein